jgi:predicted lactoylglutathione lyase
MATQIFVNLHVKDVKRSTAFFQKLGFKVNPQFSDETTSCIVISENIFAMLLSHAKFSMFTPKEISDATRTTEVLTAIFVESREKVNEIVDAALASGATIARPPEDHGFMLGRSFNDLDGHIWEVGWLDMAAFPKKE